MVTKLKGQNYKQVLDQCPVETLLKWCAGLMRLNSGVSVRGYVLSHILACSTMFLNDSHLTNFPLFVLAINYWRIRKMMWIL